MALKDGIYKIFLCAYGEAEDASEELREFLSYIAGGKPGSEYTKRLETEVVNARHNREWRKSYMTYEEHLKHIAFVERRKALEEGRAEGLTIKDQLFKCMQKDGRLDDYARSVDDPELFEALTLEYGLIPKDERQ